MVIRSLSKIKWYTWLLLIISIMLLGISIYWLGPYKGKGHQTVDTAIQHAEAILDAPSHGFLKQIALVESQLGYHKGTYDGSGGCGIWQVDQIALEATKDIRSHPNLIKAHANIIRHLKLNWQEVSCDDLNYPLLGAMAARMYLMNIPEVIPMGLQERAVYWKVHYNTDKGAGTVDDFLRVNRG